MIVEEKGIRFNIPNNLQWEKLDEWELYRKELSSIGLKAVDFVFYGNKRLVFLEIKNFNPSLDSIREREVIIREKERILRQFNKNEISVGLANKLVSSVYMIFAKKLSNMRNIEFYALLILPDRLKAYLSMIGEVIGRLETDENKLLNVKVAVLDDVSFAEQVLNSII